MDLLNAYPPEWDQKAPALGKRQHEEIEPDEPDPVEQEDDEKDSKITHIKIKWCPRINWTALAKKIYEPEPAKCLVMAEGLSTSTGHVHLQGFSRRSDRALEKILSDVKSQHSLTEEHKRKTRTSKEYAAKHKRVNISSRKKVDATELGFQYVCKEVNVPIYSQNFTQEELLYLHEHSNLYVKAKKESAADIVNKYVDQHGLPDPEHSQFLPRMVKLYENCRTAVLKARVESATRVTSRYFKDDILNALCSHKRTKDKHLHEFAKMF